MASVVLSRSPALVRYVTTQNITVTLSVFDDNGAPADSAQVTLTTTTPSGVDVDAGLTRASTGVYTSVITLDAAGRWSFHGQSLGTLVAADTLAITVEDSGLSGIPADSTLLVVANPPVAKEGTILSSTNARMYSPKQFWIIPAIDPTGVVDATAEIQRCQLVAFNQVGSVVYVPPGTYKVGTGYTIGQDVFNIWYGTSLIGPEHGLQTGNRVFDDGHGNPSLAQVNANFVNYGTGRIFRMHYQSALKHVQTYNPDQPATDAQFAANGGVPKVKDWEIYIGPNEPASCIENVVLTNPYKGIFINSPAKIVGVQGFPRSIGMHLSRIADVQRVYDCGWNRTVDFANGSALTAWVKANGRAFLVDGPELFDFYNCGGQGYNKSLVFVDEDGDGFVGVYGSWSKGGFDGGNWCIVLEANCPLSQAGFKVSDASMVSIGGAGVGGMLLCQDDQGGSGYPSFLFPQIELTNTTIHGTYSRGVWLLPTSRAQVTWTNGYAEGNTDELALGQSTSGGLVRLNNVGSRVGAARAHSTIWNQVKDRNGWITDPSTPANSSQHGSVHKTAQTTNIGATNIYGDSGGTPPKGQAVATLTLAVTTGGAAGTLTLTVFNSNGTSAGAATISAAATGTASALRGLVFDGANPPQYTITGVTAGCVFDFGIDLAQS